MLNRLHTCKSEGFLFLRFLLQLELSEPEGLDDTQDSLGDSSSFIYPVINVFQLSTKF